MTDKEKKKLEENGSKSNHRQKLASFASLGKGTWSWKGSLVGADVVAKSKDSRVGDPVPKRKARHATDSHFRSVVN